MAAINTFIYLHLAWGIFFYWYIVFMNGPLERHKGTTFYQFAQEKVCKGNGYLLHPMALKLFTCLHIALFFAACWFAWPYYAIRWASLDIAHITMRYWFPLWLRWSIRKKSPQQVAEWRDRYLAKLTNVAGNL